MLLGLFVFFFSVVANAAEPAKPVFVKAACTGKLSSAVLQRFEEELRRSQRYQRISTVDDNGRMDVVLQVYLSCAEHDNLAAVAIVYGLAHCFESKHCRVAMDGNTLTAILCDSNGIENCGQLLFRSFDNYVSRYPTPLRLE
jgi:hypothetical protein